MGIARKGFPGGRYFPSISLFGNAKVTLVVGPDFHHCHPHDSRGIWELEEKAKLVEDQEEKPEDSHNTCHLSYPEENGDAPTAPTNELLVQSQDSEGDSPMEISKENHEVLS